MAEQKKEPLYLTIVNAAPELDFLFALARHTKVSITFEYNGMKEDKEVYIDSLGNGLGERIHPLRQDQEPTNAWFIKGHFWGNGKDTFSNMFRHAKSVEEQEFGRYEERGFGEAVEKGEEIELWGGFEGIYEKGKRKGQISVMNYKIKPYSKRVPLSY